MFYPVKTPWWLKKLYSTYTWQMPAEASKTIYLSFDDGPHSVATPFVLDELRKYNAKATFFCIGKNVREFPQLYKRIIEEGHAVGNHTFNHLNGWKTNDRLYFENMIAAREYIDSELFRPPYGKISRFQSRLINNAKLKIIMWSVLSGDFDHTITSGKCLKNVLNNCEDGSIIVFHDSEKAFTHLRYVLPEVLKKLSDQGYAFGKITK